MRAERWPIAALAVVWTLLQAAGQPAVGQTWARPGDILFDSFGAVPRNDESVNREMPSTLVNSVAHSEIIDEGRTERFAQDEPSNRIRSVGSQPRPGAAPVSATRQPPGSREWHVLPGSLLYQSYLAGEKEPRTGLSVLHDSKRGWLWESALGGRLGLVRRGDLGLRPANAWQIDLEGAALARVNPTQPSTPLEATDYRIGMQWTKRTGAVAYKAGYYHISSHAGDEFLLANPGFNRINYVRDSLIFGVMQDVTPDIQVYGEVGYALGVSGGAEPLEVQFGTQYLPVADSGLRGSPFAAVNVHLREEVGFGGGINVMAGWRWRGAESGRVLRIGLQYYNGKSIQYEFFDEDQQLFGYGVWADF